MFAEMCLYEFAALYQPAYKQQYEENCDAEEDFPDEIQQCRQFKLMNNKGFVKARTQPAIVRYAYFNPIEDTENYYYSLLLLYLPFREETFTNNYPSSADAFQALHDSLRKKDQNPIINVDFTQELDRCIARLAERLPGSQSSDIVAQEVSNGFEDPDSQANLHEPAVIQAPLVDHAVAVQTLSSEQRQIFNKIIHAVNTNAKGVRIVAMGSGGVG